MFVRPALFITHARVLTPNDSNYCTSINFLTIFCKRAMGMTIFSYVLVIVASLLALPVFVFFIEIVAGAAFSSRKSNGEPMASPRLSVAVLIPAHNESACIRATFQSIKPQLHLGDRLLVVADNCSDDTANIAADLGAEVIVRNDPNAIGKGYALDYGIRHLSLDSRPIIVVVDADCCLEEGTIALLAAECVSTNRPIQALDLMTAPTDSPINYHVAEFAWRVKNWLRPSGLSALNLPCQLMGTGMAFPWGLISSLGLAGGSIVEDLKLGLDLAQAGKPPIFCPSAKVVSQFPQSIEGAKSQRQRWEQGHVRMILTAAPRLLYKAITLRNLSLFALTLDLLVPPLSLLMIIITGMFFVSGLAVVLDGPPIALFVSAASLGALATAVLLAWARCGRDILPLRRLFSIVGYVFAKLPLYSQLLSRRSDPQWVRTDRRKKTGASDHPIVQPPLDP